MLHFWSFLDSSLPKITTFWECQVLHRAPTRKQRPWRWELSRRKALRVPVPPRCSRPDPTTTVDSKGWWEMFQFQCLRFLSCFIVFKREKKNVWTLNHFNFLYFSNFLSHLLSTLNQSSQFFYCEFFPLKSPFQAPRHMRSDLFGAGVWKYFPVLAPGKLWEWQTWNKLAYYLVLPYCVLLWNVGDSLDV